ncbi:sigma-70 family RNA polymerase sigma factor [Aureisphaera galaxeae]|uniref:RNA polymerase sigma factor n=1 Tax=Aureisphaera galaxeae TaxID=1538023 RepID=UPI00235039F9|nr:sigma-70 family RNA polymerase sigma factor [Aureisphaera galaxeae]MDC8002649.1 sigma-70 family RNA polymerase sigma factor [Aureisphaera galaxeae]
MGQNTVHDDQKYIDALLQNDGKRIQEIYTKFAPKVIGFVKQNSGDEDAAKDLIQEVLLIIYDQAKTKDLKLTCPFDAYFFMICKRKWFTRLKKSAKERVTNDPLAGFDSETLQDQVQQTEHFETKMQLFKELFQKLGDTCKEILQLSFGSFSMEEIASQLNISYAYARKKKSLCIGQLTKWAQESQVYKQLKEL